MWAIEMRYYTLYFTTHRNAEIFCGENGISPKEIFFDEDL